jgi:hypothetical protein
VIPHQHIRMHPHLVPLRHLIEQPEEMPALPVIRKDRAPVDPLRATSRII